jgi:phytol kinase
MSLNNIFALFITFVLALTWLRLNNWTARRRWISSELSRKIIHIGTGPLFVLCWLFFDNSPLSRWLAALVPLSITIQFLLVGLGIIQDESAVQAMSRSGKRNEILQGPLYYGIVFVCLTLLFWRDSPIGIVALMLLCGGDGLADVLGRQLGKAPLPWNPSKTIAGSLAMFIGGWVFVIVILFIFIQSGIFHNPLIAYLPSVTLITLSATIVESLPLPDIDNITVSLVSVILGYVLF